MSLVFVSDLHLAPLTWQDQPDVRGDAYVAWMQVVNYCVNSNAEALIIGGDIFDKSRPDSESVEAFQLGMDILTQNAILVYFTQGNHDRADPPWASALSPAAKYIGDGEPAMIEVDGAHIMVRGYDNMPAAHLKQKFDELREFPENPDIVIVHQLEKTFVPYEGSWDFDMSWVPEGVKLILAGDYHDPVQTGRLWYTGSTYSTNITEFGPRSCLDVTYEPNAGVFGVRRVPLTKRDVREFTVVVDDHLVAAVRDIDALPHSDSLPEAIRRPLVFVKYSTNVKDALPALEEACQRHNHILRTKVLAGGVEVVGEIEKPQGDVTLEACLGQVVNREEDEEFYSFALALLKSQKPADVLTETKAHLGVS